MMLLLMLVFDVHFSISSCLTRPFFCTFPNFIPFFAINLSNFRKSFIMGNVRPKGTIYMAAQKGKKGQKLSTSSASSSQNSQIKQELKRRTKLANKKNKKAPAAMGMSGNGREKRKETKGRDR
ncbi:hypothetical protein GPALN_007850 [Globodera pallida]|nr:hypothetical protein GPALN_007850 [Globodera pallida]